MTTKPSGEARVTSIPTHGDVADRSTDSPTEGSQSQVPLLASVPAPHSAVASAEQQDVDQASTEPATSEATSASGDTDTHEATAEHDQEPKETTALLARPAPDALQISVSPQKPVWGGLVQDSRMTPSSGTLQRDSLGKEETPQTAGVPDREQELSPTTPSAEVLFPRIVEAQPAASTADAFGQLDTRAAGTAEAVEETPEAPEALDAGTEAWPSAESQAVTEGDLVARSGDRQPGPSPPSPGGSAPPSPGPHAVARGRRPPDSSLYTASEENSYLRSMTSLLGGGEGSISSLADILVWSETTMGLATGFLASGHSSVTDLLRSTGPSLRSVSSILRNASSAFSSGLAAGTEAALRSVTRTLETVERRTVEGIHSAVCYLTSHLTPHRAQARPNSN
ncbi:hypothetical protein HPG69_019043 [Diceros bicornis minor]|uniref:Testis-expressed protein 44 n=1 Tax=Diceros bicornis minor TaxID=77932 RepID=A0A7J7EJK0_DICBM|nr:hypothetical protein HPG69_019043 [Diceros bicornis minor]